MIRVNPPAYVPPPIILEALSAASADMLWEYLSPQGKARMVLEYMEEKSRMDLRPSGLTPLPPVRGPAACVDRMRGETTAARDSAR